MTPKIKVNLASAEEFLSIKGIGKAKSVKIAEFIKKGGKFNSIEEFQNVVKLQPAYLDKAKELLDFEESPVMFPKPPVLTFPKIPLVPIEPVPFQSFRFTVQLKGIDNDNKENPYEGYKVVVGYSIIGKPFTKSFVPDSKGKTEVKLYTYFRTAVSNNIHLMVTSPENSIVYDSRFDIEHEEEIEIRLPSFEDQNLEIKIQKKAGVNYEDHKLRVRTKLDRGESGVDTLVKSYEIANSSIVDISYDNFGKVLEITLQVISSFGEPFYEAKLAWVDIVEENGLKKLEINLPGPMKETFDIQLVVDPEELNNPYLDHRALVSYDLKDPGTFEVIRRVEESHLIDALGKSKIIISHYGPIDNILLQVKAPGGEIIGKRSIDLGEIDNNNEIEIKVPPRELAGLEGIETLPERPEKSVGRVIDSTGSSKFSKAQVILYAAKKEDPEEEDFIPLIISRTENDGYFQIITPVGYFTKAFAKVGIPKKGNTEGKDFDIPIRLEEDTVVVVENGNTEIKKKLFFPASIVLVVDHSEGDDSSENCNDCNLNFHKDKAVVDEFSFYTVVRTTEPTIQGYTLEEDGEMTIQDIIDIVPVASDSNGEELNIPAAYRKKSINKNILTKYINDKKGLTFTTLIKALNESNARKLRKVIKPQRQVKAFGRYVLDLDSSIDWDKDPTIYQATTLSHGHLLHYKQEWISDGYSLGDLLYSLPLAPGQKKQIVVYDWERRESASRRESLDYQESLYNSLSRDRDINEIVTGTLDESMRGGSTAKTSSFGAGLGIGGIFKSFGGLLGVSGGSSKASSKAWQNSSRKTSLNDMQSLRDKTVQSANAIRSQRGSIVQTATQGERFSVETEVVANYNHCHSLTIQYFEVLRHLKVQHRLSSVQEALFIPLMMTTFDYQKILRWREILEKYVWARKLKKGFGAIERIENDYEGSDLPEGTFSQENIDYIEGELYLQIDIPSPTDLSILKEKQEVTNALSFMGILLPGLQSHIDRIFKAKAELRNEIFFKYVAPRVANAIVEKMQFEAVIESGVDGNESRKRLPLDATLVSNFSNGKSHYVSLRQNDSVDGLSRHSIKAIEISKASKIVLGNGLSLMDNIPANTRVIVNSGSLRYRTDHASDVLFRKSSIKDDLIGYGGFDREFVRIATPLNRRELRNPRNEDFETANALQDHLNDNMEFFHKAIWMNMSPERRFMFLDGIQINDYSESEKYPLGIVRSVASVVENRVIGIIGNNLVMPVAPGFRLDPNTRGNDVDLISLYKPVTPIEPINLTIPTKGVFAEAVNGKCNSCEEIENNRFWRWSEEPLPDSPTPIGTVNTDTRRSEPLDTTPTSFPSPVVNIQSAPAAPDPTGLAQAAELLKNTNFRDITGLTENQKNALEGLKASLEAAKTFGTKAADMAALGAQLENIDKARKNGLLDNEQAKKQTQKALDNFNEGKVGDVDAQLDTVKTIHKSVKDNEIPKDAGEKLTNKVITGKPESKQKAVDNKAINKKIEEAQQLEYQNETETLKVSREDKPPVDTTLLKFMVNFRKPKTFKWKTGAVVDYQGHFGFDWLRDEYVNPMEMVLSDLNKDPLNTITPLCTDPAKLKTEYLNGDPNPIKPFENDYYPAWLAIMPYTREEEFEHGSNMHMNGLKLSLEIQEIDAMTEHDNEITLNVQGSADGILKITPSSFTVADILKKGKKKQVVIDQVAKMKKTIWLMEDFVKVECVGGVLENHTEILVEAHGTDRSETVGKLMVYANNRIPKAEIVMVRFSYTGDAVNLDSSYHSILKNNSFNQALIRAEVLEDEKFVLNNLPNADPDVAAFKASYPDGAEHDGETFLNDLMKLYEKFGNRFPQPDEKRTILFITDQEADAGGIAEGKSVLGKFVWGNAVVIFGTNLDSENTFVHEIGHSLGLPHTFEPTAMVGANNKHKYYRGYTDNVMDYTTKYDGTVAKGTLPNPHDREMFFKWQWDVMRTDQSLKDDY